MSFTILLEEISSNLNKIIKQYSIPKIEFSVEPAKLNFGDASSNISFILAKHLGKKPSEISKELASKYEPFLSDLIDKVIAHQSGYLNFYANTGKLNKLILCKTIGKDYGTIDIGNNRPLVVEHTSVNPNKALHIGHVRNVVIGDSLARILRKANYDVKVLNYVDDSGLQVADIILGFKYLGFSESPPDDIKFDHYCGDTVYVKTSQQYEKDPSLQNIRKKILQELENEKSEIAQFADRITNKVLRCQLETCWELNAYYDCLNFESQIIRSGLWLKIFEQLKDKQIVQFEKTGKNQGCWVIRAKNNEEDKVIVRSNGTATYIAKDIPYAAWKLGIIPDPFYYKKFDPPQPFKTLWQTTLEKTNESKQNFSGKPVITVIDSRQARLQKIVSSLMTDFTNDPRSYIHLSYESVTLSSDTAKQLGMKINGKQTQMSGRKGLYVNADAVIELLESKAKEETSKRNSEWSEDEIKKTAHYIAIGTLRYEMIKQDLDKIITFDLSKSLSLEGDTASYLQYSHARASRILEKAKQKPDFNSDFTKLDTSYEKNLIRLLGLYEKNIQDATNNLSPKTIARYCHDLAVAFNSFYEHLTVLNDPDTQLRNQRLCLVLAFKKIICDSLNLLGITAPEKM